MSAEADLRTGSTFLYFVVGLSVGLSISALFTPKSGEQTRATLVLKANELKGRAAAAVENGKNMVSDKKDQIAAAVDAGREVYKQEIAKSKAAGSETQS